MRTHLGSICWIKGAFSSAVGFAVVFGLAGCDSQSGGGGAASASVSAPVPASVAAPMPLPASVTAPSRAGGRAASAASADEEASQIQLLKFTFTSNVRDKEPVDKLDAAKPGQRVWAHINVRNRTGSNREIDLVFRVNGKERSRVPLEIQASWSFRTWGYVTLRAADTSGEVTAVIIDDSGEEILSERLPIRP